MFQSFRRAYCLHLQGDWIGSSGCWSVAVNKNVLVILEVWGNSAITAMEEGCDWSNSFKTSSIIDTLSATASLQHPSEPIQSPWRRAQYVASEMLKHMTTIWCTDPKYNHHFNFWTSILEPLIKLNNYRVASTGLDKPVILHGTSIYIHWCLY
jgi:hypothetical protein